MNGPCKSDTSASCCGGHETGAGCGVGSAYSDSAASSVERDASQSDGCQSASCGCSGNPVFDGMDNRYKLVLWIVIAMNGAMFLIEMLAGKLAGSQSLQADALDFLGDFLTYGMSLSVIGMSLRVRSTAAMIKGLSLLAMGLWILGTTLYQVLFLSIPEAEIMGLIGFLALATNLGAVLLLSRYKDGDANVRSVWLCSRNDAIGNVSVIGASVLVFLSSSGWPDIVVALGMSGLFLRSAQLILKQSLEEYRFSHV